MTGFHISGSSPPHTRLFITAGTVQCSTKSKHGKMTKGWRPLVIFGSRGKLVVADVQTLSLELQPSESQRSML